MKIYIAKNPPEAHFISELLLAEKIPVEVRSVGLFGLQGELPMDDSTQPHVWLLDPAYKEKAEAIIKAYMEADEQADWTCSECGEVNEGQFALCWNCGTSSPTE
ncbi:hypothetical protein JCM19241_3014 [Vibrio ishigakensis]|uniref:RanBP2-type domain-containing protein n=1 Tax=Vibrio ishigakensis TaxID=1481914 RepID=A0A0B8QG18_9VIBR|nr:hypothetical protein JCM19241_3014 [Vibrio ishigakensis]